MSADRILKSTPNEKVTFAELQAIIEYFDKTCFNNHSIQKEQMEKIREIYEHCTDIKNEVRNFKSHNAKLLTAFLKKVQKKICVSLPAIDRLKNKILICKILNQDSSDDILNATLAEVEIAVDEF